VHDRPLVGGVPALNRHDRHARRCSLGVLTSVFSGFADTLLMCTHVLLPVWHAAVIDGAALRCSLADWTLRVVAAAQGGRGTDDAGARLPLLLHNTHGEEAHGNVCRQHTCMWVKSFTP
jgi:hypothetical protein